MPVLREERPASNCQSLLLKAFRRQPSIARERLDYGMKRGIHFFSLTPFGRTIS